ncbi:glycosyltransferase family 2 protein [Roseivirga pacifica]|uniref:glycosyltransferase family 2 protein n=1 Tax=Roseivirga pacifica TaxID=1267423 RepID=UPI003BABCA25
MLFKPLISVIIPVYNRERLLPQTVRSIFEQTYECWELIIVDDGSKDNSYQIAKGFESDNRVKVFKRPNEFAAGGCGARNFGLQESNGDFVKWLDSDDLLASDCLEKQIQNINSSDSNASFCQSVMFTENGTELNIDYARVWGNVQIQESLVDEYITGKVRLSVNSGLWSRKVLPKKPFNEKLRNSQEWEMIINALSKGTKYSIVDRPLVLVREHEDRMHKDRDYLDYSRNQIMARLSVIDRLKFEKVDLHPITKRYLLKNISHYFLTALSKKPVAVIGLLPMVLKLYLKLLSI